MEVAYFFTSQSAPLTALLKRRALFASPFNERWRTKCDGEVVPMLKLMTLLFEGAVSAPSDGSAATFP